MNYELKPLDMNMGKLEYDMYQDIPLQESGSTNLCNGLPYSVFKNFLETQISRRYQNISYHDTPTSIYILYVNNYPVGYIGLRTKIDDNWKKWSGNTYYVIRVSERRKGYATKMVELAKMEFQKLGYKEIFMNSSFGNIASSKVIENNGGEFLEEVNGSKYYRIIL